MERLAQGAAQAELARSYGVSQSTNAANASGRPAAGSSIQNNSGLPKDFPPPCGRLEVRKAEDGPLGGADGQGETRPRQSVDCHLWC